MKRLYLLCGLVLTVNLPILALTVHPVRIMPPELMPIPIVSAATINSFRFPTPTATATSTATSTSTATATATVVAPILVQQKTATGTAASFDVTFDNPTTNGNTLIACIADTAGGVSSIGNGSHDSLGSVVIADGTGISSEIWASNSELSDGSTTFTVTKGDAILRATVNLQEWSGLIGNVDTSSSNTGLANATVTTGAITASLDSNLIIACGGWVADDYSTGPTNSFTRLTAAGAGSIWLESAYKYQSTAASISTGWGLSAGVNWAATIAAFPAP